MIFLPVFLSLLAGYSTIVLVQMGGMFLVTRLGKRHLMVGDSLSNTYFFLLALVWFVSAVASGYLTAYLAPFPPIGSHLFCAAVAIFAVWLVFRNDRELPTHQPTLITLTLIFVIAAGYLAGDLLNYHA